MTLDPKVLYWTWAWANMALVMGCAYSGLRQIRRLEIARHKQRMLTAAALVILFLVSYVFKRVLLGPEELEAWQRSFVYVLRLHEACVFTLLISGGSAVYLAYKLRLADPEGSANADPVRRARGIRRHRRAGWTALVSGTLGLLTSAYVLFGMFQVTMR